MQTEYANFRWPQRVDIPQKMPRSATHVATALWSWSPNHNRQDTYHLSTNRGRSHWILWSGYYDDNETFTWQHYPYAYGPNAGVAAEEAARALLHAGWKGEVEERGGLDHFHEVTSEGLLSTNELLEIGKVVWAEPLTAEQREAERIEQWLFQAERGDDPSALNIMGYLRFFGKGVKRSRKRAVELWSNAAESGHPRAKLNLAICFRDGYGVRKNEPRALQLYEELAHEGYVQGLEQAAFCRRAGIGAKPNTKLALRWYLRWAKAEGPKVFNNGFVDCLAAGTGRTQLEKEARLWLSKNAAKHVASRNMRAILGTTAVGRRVPKRKSAGLYKLSHEDVDVCKVCGDHTANEAETKKKAEVSSADLPSLGIRRTSAKEFDEYRREADQLLKQACESTSRVVLVPDIFRHTGMRLTRKKMVDLAPEQIVLGDDNNSPELPSRAKFQRSCGSVSRSRNFLGETDGFSISSASDGLPWVLWVKDFSRAKETWENYPAAYCLDRRLSEKPAAARLLWSWFRVVSVISPNRYRCARPKSGGYFITQFVIEVFMKHAIDAS